MNRGNVLRKKYGLLLILILAITYAGIVYADQGVPAVPETQGLVTTTGADVVGIASETNAGVWTITNNPQELYSYTAVNGNYVGLTLDSLDQLIAQGGSYQSEPPPYPPLGKYVTQLSIPQSLLNVPIVGGPGLTWGELVSTEVGMGWFTGPVVTGAGIHTGALDHGQVKYTTAYDATIFSQAGHVLLAKSMNLNSGNKVLSQSNLKAQTVLSYIATGDGGNVIGTENLLIDGVGNTTTSGDRVLCPFAAVGDNYIPAYCNIVQMGSSYDLTVGSVTTQADNRFVGTEGTNPVVQNYQINVKPYDTTSGSIPAMGSTSAYIKVHIQEARNNGTPLKSEDLQYSETSSASGMISRFSKSMAYSSQFSGSSPRGFHTIYASSLGGAGISPSGPVTVQDGGSQTFLFSHITSPNLFGVDGFQVSIDGAPFTHWVDSYTFSNVISDHSIIVRVPA